MPVAQGLAEPGIFLVEMIEDARVQAGQVNISLEMINQTCIIPLLHEFKVQIPSQEHNSQFSRGEF